MFCGGLFVIISAICKLCHSRKDKKMSLSALRSSVTQRRHGPSRLSSDKIDILALAKEKLRVMTKENLDRNTLRGSSRDCAVRANNSSSVGDAASPTRVTRNDGERLLSTPSPLVARTSARIGDNFADIENQGPRLFEELQRVSSRVICVESGSEIVGDVALRQSGKENKSSGLVEKKRTEEDAKMRSAVLFLKEEKKRVEAEKMKQRRLAAVYPGGRSKWMMFGEGGGVKFSALWDLCAHSGRDARDSSKRDSLVGADVDLVVGELEWLGEQLVPYMVETATMQPGSAKDKRLRIEEAVKKLCTPSHWVRMLSFVKWTNITEAARQSQRDLRKVKKDDRTAQKNKVAIETLNKIRSKHQVYAQAASRGVGEKGKGRMRLKCVNVWRQSQQVLWDSPKLDNSSLRGVGAVHETPGLTKSVMMDARQRVSLKLIQDQKEELQRVVDQEASRILRSAQKKWRKKKKNGRRQMRERVVGSIRARMDEALYNVGLKVGEGTASLADAQAAEVDAQGKGGGDEMKKKKMIIDQLRKEIRDIVKVLGNCDGVGGDGLSGLLPDNSIHRMGLCVWREELRTKKKQLKEEESTLCAMWRGDDWQKKLNELSNIVGTRESNNMNGRASNQEPEHDSAGNGGGDGEFGDDPEMSDMSDEDGFDIVCGSGIAVRLPTVPGASMLRLTGPRCPPDTQLTRLPRATLQIGDHMGSGPRALLGAVDCSLGEGEEGKRARKRVSDVLNLEEAPYITPIPGVPSESEALRRLDWWQIVLDRVRDLAESRNSFGSGRSVVLRSLDIDDGGAEQASDSEDEQDEEDKDCDIDTVSDLCKVAGIRIRTWKSHANTQSKNQIAAMATLGRGETAGDGIEEIRRQHISALLCDRGHQVYSHYLAA